MKLGIVILLFLVTLLINYLMIVEGFFDKKESSTQFSDTIQSILTHNPNKHPHKHPHKDHHKHPHIKKEQCDESKMSHAAVIAKYETLRNLLKADVKDAVKNEVLAQRALINPTTCAATSNKSSSSLQQGSWFRGGKDSTSPYGKGQRDSDNVSQNIGDISDIQDKKYGRKHVKPDDLYSFNKDVDDNDYDSIYPFKRCEKQPDMSKYIRKDSIPCYGCTLPT
jgi:hypothetical protein